MQVFLFIKKNKNYTITKKSLIKCIKYLLLNYLLFSWIEPWLEVEIADSGV